MTPLCPPTLRGGDERHGGRRQSRWLYGLSVRSPTPEVSNLNYNANGVIPNLVIASPGTNGEVCLYNPEALDLIVDIAGVFPAGSGYAAQASPQRAVDTRGSGARVGGTAIREVAVAGGFRYGLSLWPADTNGIKCELREGSGHPELCHRETRRWRQGLRVVLCSGRCDRRCLGPLCGRNRIHRYGCTSSFPRQPEHHTNCSGNIERD